MEDLTVKIKFNDDMRGITLTSPTGDTLRVLNEEAIDFFVGVHKFDNGECICTSKCLGVYHKDRKCKKLDDQ